MGLVDKRVRRLEESLSDVLRDLDPGPEELARRLFRKAYGSLSVVEMHVMTELAQAYRARPGLSPAEVWHELSEAQRAMQYRWLGAMRVAARELIDSGDLPPGTEAELKELVRALGNYPFWKEGDELGTT